MPDPLSDVAAAGVITRKMADWLESIEDVTLREQLRLNLIVAGGAIVSLLTGEKVNDFDVYIRDVDVAVAVADYYLAQAAKTPPGRYVSRGLFAHAFVDPDGRARIKIGSSGIIGELPEGVDAYQIGNPPGETRLGQAIESGLTLREQAEQDDSDLGDVAEALAADTVSRNKDRRPYSVRFITENALTLSDGIQLCIRFSGEPEDVLQSFDFVHCTNYWTSDNGELVLSLAALKSLLSKRLVYVGSLYPICSLIRTRKFIQRGWKAPASVFVKAAAQISALDLTSPVVWREQLTGVDAAYFTQLLYLLDQAVQDGAVLDSAYVVQLIDSLY